MKSGYTLVELMVTVTIITLLTTFGVSAYGRAQSSQAARAASETIMAALTEAQKKASSGTNNCTGSDPGEYLGQQVTLQASEIETTPLCRNSNGSTKEVALSGVTFTATRTFIFRPLNQGVILNGGNTNIDYSVSGHTYRIQVTGSGSITNKGQQS